MKYLFMVTSTLLFLMTACSSEESIPDELLSEEEGEFRVIAVSEVEGKKLHKAPSFFHELNDPNVIMRNLEMITLDNAQHDPYKSLGIEEAPYFIFFDQEGIAFETNSEEEAYEFVEKALEKEID
ncbi:hypothetical protein CEY16_13265 [Halalkalibacillus sediminis]|uniref:Thioredoxin n=1 Tax=Halalkalibacillus sediminis TaxID=2018042 RepID=A0A2I0QR31_9BACI|nr:hypothetical protein [Halalkalibacillus sediminis]PKR76783.1 hypothetical protein CEY16_13265 [Halalkalibacillus sediminis]